MCTALFYPVGDGFFGRNLDLEYAYEEQVTVTPRYAPLSFRCEKTLTSHYAMIGTAYVPNGYPLYYEAVNEKGLCIAGLNFPGEAVYRRTDKARFCVAPFEVIPWVLSQCATLREACILLKDTCVAPLDYSAALPSTPLHWLLGDASGSVAVEPLAQGLSLCDDPVGVLTNSPRLEYHLTRLCDYTALSTCTPPTVFGEVPVPLYSRGMGAMGLPGDFSSSSRFVKAAFVKTHAVSETDELSCVSQCFHILDSVAHPRGCVQMPDGRQEITVYSCCCNMKTGMYYYKTYDGGWNAVGLRRTALEGDSPVVYPFRTKPLVFYQN